MRLLNRWWPLTAAVVLLAAAGVSASLTRLPLSRVEVDAGGVADQDGRELEEVVATTVAAKPLAEQPAFTLPEWILPGLMAVAVCVVVIVIALTVGASLRSGSRFRQRRLRTSRLSDVKPGVDAEVVAALDAGLHELDEADADPRRVVIACWVRLERAAGAAGTRRQPGDTATDLVLRLLQGHRLSESVLTGFADVYRVARFASRHDVDEGMREQAKAALWRLRGELTGATA